MRQSRLVLMAADKFLFQQFPLGPAILISAIVLILPGCSRPSKTPEQESTAPAPVKSAATPAPTTSNPPKGPESEVYYVVKSFSVTTDSGVHGFRPGMAVRLVRKDGNMLVVADGRLRVRAAATYFSRNPDDRGPRAPISQTPAQPTAIPAKAADPSNAASSSSAVSSKSASPTPNFQTLLERKAARAAAEAKAAREKLVKALKAEVGNLDKRIKAAEMEISARGSKQAANPRHYTYDAWGNAVLYQGTYVVTYSADATGIEQLRSDRDRLKQRLADLTAE